MPPADQRFLCNWSDNYGQSVPQVTVRNQSTKDSVGTLPLYSYTQPLTLMTSDNLETSNANDSSDPSNAIVLFQCQTTIVVKPSLVAGLGLGLVTSTVLQNELE